MSKKLEQGIKPKETKPSIARQDCVVYKFVCDLCDADYVDCSAIGKHLFFVFSRSATGNLTASFTKCYSSKN